MVQTKISLSRNKQIFEIIFVHCDVLTMIVNAHFYTLAPGKSSALCEAQPEPEVPADSALTGRTRGLPPLAPLRGYPCPSPRDERADGALCAPPAGTIIFHRAMTVYRAFPADGHFFCPNFQN